LIKGEEMMTTKMRMLWLGALLFISLVLVVFPAIENNTANAQDDEWAELQKDFFGDKEILPTNGDIEIITPAAAHNAALIPVTVLFKAPIIEKAKKLHLILDENPAPLAAVFEFGEGFRNKINIGERTITTRLRAEYTSKVRAILETTDGKYYMSSSKVDFVSAGGCSAPMAGDLEFAVRNLGKIRISTRKEETNSQDWREGTVMIRHPNLSGMQMDPKSGSFMPAWYVKQIIIKQKQDLIFRVNAGISLSQNPHFRFTYPSTISKDNLQVEVRDSKGNHFQKTHVVEGS